MHHRGFESGLQGGCLVAFDCGSNFHNIGHEVVGHRDVAAIVIPFVPVTVPLVVVVAVSFAGGASACAVGAAIAIFTALARYHVDDLADVVALRVVGAVAFVLTLTRAIAPLGLLAIVGAEQLLFARVGEIHPCRVQLVDLRLVDQRQRCLAVFLVSRNIADHVVNDDLAQRDHIGRGILLELAHPAFVAPADAGLEVLGHDRVVAERLQRQARFQAAHDAAVHADHVEVHVRVRLERLLHLVDRQGRFFALELVVTEAVHRARTMIPEHQHVTVGRVVLHAPADEVGKGVGVGRVELPQAVVDELELALVHDIALRVVGRDTVILPFLRAERFDDDVRVLADARFKHLGDVARGFAGF